MAKSYSLTPAGWYFADNASVTRATMGRYIWVYNVPADLTGNIDSISFKAYLCYGSGYTGTASTSTYYTTMFQTWNKPTLDTRDEWISGTGWEFLMHGANSGESTVKQSSNGITRDKATFSAEIQNIVADVSKSIKLTSTGTQYSFSFSGSAIKQTNAANWAGNTLYVITYCQDSEEYLNRYVYAGRKNGSKVPLLTIVTDGSSTAPDSEDGIGLYVYKNAGWTKLNNPPYIYREERDSVSNNIKYPSSTNKMTDSNATSSTKCSQTFNADGQSLTFTASASSGSTSSSANWLWYAFDGVADSGSDSYFRGSSSSVSNIVTMTFSLPIYEASLKTLIQSQSSSWRPSSSSATYTITWYNGSTQIGTGTINGLNTAAATKTINLTDTNNVGITKVTVTGTYMGIGEFTYNFKLSTHNPEGFNVKNQSRAVYAWNGTTWQLVCGS